MKTKNTQKHKCPKNPFFRNISNNLTFADKTLLVTILISLLVFTTINRMTVSNITANHNNMIDTSLSTLARNSEIQLNNYIEKQMDILHYYAGRPEIYGMKYEEQSKFFFNEKIPDNPYTVREETLDFHHFFVVNMSGTGFYFAENVIRQHYQEQFFRDIMDNDEFITKPYYEPDGYTTIITLCVSIYDEHNQKCGVLCGALELNKIKNLFFENEVIFDGKCFVVNNKGNFIAADNMKDVYDMVSVIESCKSNLDIINKTFETKTDQIGTDKINDKTYRLYSVYIPNYEWAIVFYIDINDIKEPLLKFEYFQNITLLLLLLMSVCLGRIVYLWHRSNKTIFTDTLTGTRSRAAFENAIAKLEKTNCKAAIVYMDLNNFKSVNDNYGHDTGDQILCIFADTIKNVFDKYGMVARLGGDEFAAILIENNADAEFIEMLCHSVQDELKAKSKQLPFNYIISSSYGYSFREKESNISLNYIISIADANMYKFKDKYKLKLKKAKQIS